MKRNLFAGLLSAASDLSSDRAALIGRCAGVAPEPRLRNPTVEALNPRGRSSIEAFETLLNGVFR